jgi:predicted nuclease of restriction endonuclease-like (RecB) superfamily
MRITDGDARRFYEAETVRAKWSRRDLERQINSLYHQRLPASGAGGLRQCYDSVE